MIIANNEWSQNKTQSNHNSNNNNNIINYDSNDYY